jgi:hypothetical protein
VRFAILRSYKNGKETATILCDINDYFDENGLIALSPKHYKLNKESISVSFKSIIYASVITVTSEKDYPIDLLIKVEYERKLGNKEYAEITLLKNTKSISQTIDGANIQSVTLVSVSALTPMVFQTHDKVIPYIKGADGLDLPMSKYKSGNPKVFEVIETDIIYDGAIWQKLSLQEV